jgi:hypothetical protein
MNELPIRARASVVPDIADIFSESMGDGGEVLGNGCRFVPEDSPFIVGRLVGALVGAISTSGMKMGEGIDFFEAEGA